MCKFLSMQDVSLDQWSEDFKNEFLPLFEARLKESGSLSETTSSGNACALKPLPPVLEKSFYDSEIQKIECVMQCLYPNCNVQVLRLYRSTVAFAFNDSIKLASKHSRYSNCSKVFIGDQLHEIICFVQCSVLVSDPTADESTTHRHWLVRCSPYISHDCKPWYGFPTQVWASVLEDDFDYYTPQQITSRVVYVEIKVNFGRFIGEDNVLIVSPIPLFLDI